VIIDASGTRVGSSGRGQLRMLLAADADDGTTDHCAGEGRFLLQPATLDEGGEALASAPVVLEGPTLVSRLDLSTIFGLGDLPFDDLVELSARLEGDPPGLSDGNLVPSWSASVLQRRDAGGVTYLDVFLYYGGQPDVDRDGDGLEEMLDADGDTLIDGCRDGDGTVIEGAACAADPRIADAFGLSIRYQTAPAEIVGLAGD
jgi:hypothetical protein